LQRSEPREFGGAPHLFYVDPERAKKFEGVGTEWRAPGINPSCSAQTELVADRAVDQQLADKKAEAHEWRQSIALGLKRLSPFGKGTEGFEQPALHRCRIRCSDPQLG